MIKKSTLILGFLVASLFGNDISVILYQQKQLGQATKVLAVQTQYCKEKAEENPLHIDVQGLVNHHITLREFRDAVITLEERNLDHCQGLEKKNLMYQYLTLYALKRGESKEEGRHVLDTMLSTYTPSKDRLSAFARFSNLSDKKRVYLEKALGELPFDLLKVSVPVIEAMRKK